MEKGPTIVNLSLLYRVKKSGREKTPLRDEFVKRKNDKCRKVLQSYFYRYYIE